MRTMPELNDPGIRGDSGLGGVLRLGEEEKGQRLGPLTVLPVHILLVGFNPPHHLSFQRCSAGPSKYLQSPAGTHEAVTPGRHGRSVQVVARLWPQSSPGSLPRPKFGGRRRVGPWGAGAGPLGS